MADRNGYIGRAPGDSSVVVSRQIFSPTGVTTDFDGNYSIMASEGDVLSVSYVGYAAQTVTVGTSTTINVTLNLDNTLEEVVVTALGIALLESSDFLTINQSVDCRSVCDCDCIFSAVSEIGIKFRAFRYSVGFATAVLSPK